MERDSLARAQSHPGPWGQRRVPADRDQLVELGAAGLDVLEGEVERHQLDEAGGGPLFFGILGEERPALGIEQQHGLRRERGRTAVDSEPPRLGGRGEGSHDGGKHRQYGEHTAWMH